RSSCGEFCKIRTCRSAAAGRSRLVGSNCHVLFLAFVASLVEELNVVPLCEGNDCLLPIGALVVMAAEALDLAALNERVHALHFDAEELLYCITDLNLIGLEFDLKDHLLFLFF